MSRALLKLSVTFIALLSGACASTSQGQTMSPASPQGGAIDASTAPDARDGSVAARDGGTTTLGADAADRGADADFALARGKFDRGERDAARVALEEFVAQHPGHPNRADADVLLGRLALTRGDAATAKRVLSVQAGRADAEGAGASARYLLGLAELRLGNSTHARELLLPFLPRAGGIAQVAPSDDFGIELRGALAEATAPSDPVIALELWDSYLGPAREAEKEWARRRATELAGKLSPETAWRAWGAAAPGSLTRAVLGAKASSYLRQKGDAPGATFVDKETTTARHGLGFDANGTPIGPGDPTRIGLALPLSGKFQVVGEAALRAAMLAGGTPLSSPASNAGTTQLVVRDTATDPERAARGVSELTRGEAVIGIVGAASTKAGPSAIAQATEDGIAVLSLEDAAPGALTTAFQMIHAPEARAAALVRAATRLGARRFAILGPDSAAGKRLREAFRKAVTEAGGSVVTEASYVSGATSFAGPIATLKKALFDAVFVPDSAERLPLIAPALAVADLWPQAWSGKDATALAKTSKTKGTPGRPRPILLLSTASDVSRKLVETAGRYVQGALLCPGFFADDGEARARAFVESYRGAYGQEPHATEAYAYDAVATFQNVVRQGAHTRGDVVRALGAATAPLLQGLTGSVTFGPDHGRTDAPIVYVVDGPGIHAFK